MKKSSFAGTLVFVVTLTVIVCSSRNLAAQAAKPQNPKAGSTAKAASAGGLTSQQVKAVNTAWMNLNRAYLDLLSTRPDVKGDTSRLEGALKTAIEDLHQLDKFAAGPPGVAHQDVGKSREYIFKAVQDHLVLGKKVLQDSQIKSSLCEHALGQIEIAQVELNAAKTAPVK